MIPSAETLRIIPINSLIRTILERATRRSALYFQSTVAALSEHFQIQHLGLSVGDPLGLLADSLERLLGTFRRAAWADAESAPGVMRLQVHQDRHRLAHLESLPLAWQGDYDGIRFAVFRSAGRRRIALPSGAVADFDIDAAWAQLYLPQPDDILARWFLLLRIVCESLKRGRHCFLHAACLAMPRRSEWRGVVLTAPSNTGKTTAALALASSGWRLLGDDVTYLRPADLGSSVWGFPRACHIRPGTLRLLPWLAQLELGQPDTDGVRTLHPKALGDRAWLDAPWMAPALVVVVAPHNRERTRVEAIAPAEALAQLAAESLSAVPGVCDCEAADEFSQMARLVTLAPTCRLSVGPDLGEVAKTLQSFLEASPFERSTCAVPSGVVAA